MSELSERTRFIEMKKDVVGAEVPLMMLDEWWRGRIYDARQTPEASDDLAMKIDGWKATTQDQGSTTVAFTSGVFDLLHVDHHGYLFRTKLAALPIHFDRNYSADFDATWDELTQDEQAKITQSILNNNEIKLVVSIDGDKSVEMRKGNDPSKGGISPVLGWNTRARQVVSLSQPSGIGTVVDAVTIHGPDDFDSDSPHASLESLVAKLRPDVWSVYFESTDILDSAPFDQRLHSTTIVEMPSSETFFRDDLIDGKISTSAIRKRIRGV